jgi:hypothetical protein
LSDKSDAAVIQKLKDTLHTLDGLRQDLSQVIADTGCTSARGRFIAHAQAHICSTQSLVHFCIHEMVPAKDGRVRILKQETTDAAAERNPV